MNNKSSKFLKGYAASNLRRICEPALPNQERFPCNLLTSRPPLSFVRSNDITSCVLFIYYRCNIDIQWSLPSRPVHWSHTLLPSPYSLPGPPSPVFSGGSRVRARGTRSPIFRQTEPGRVEKNYFRVRDPRA